MDLASGTSGQWTESGDSFSTKKQKKQKKTLEIHKDVKKMNKKFDHLEKRVRQLKRHSKIIKDQNEIGISVFQARRPKFPRRYLFTVWYSGRDHTEFRG